MTTVQDIQAAIEKLPEEDYDRLREWSFELEEKMWDQQIEVDKHTDFPRGSRTRLTSPPSHEKLG